MSVFECPMELYEGAYFDKLIEIKQLDIIGEMKHNKWANYVNNNPPPFHKLIEIRPSPRPFGLQINDRAKSYLPEQERPWWGCTKSKVVEDVGKGLPIWIDRWRNWLRFLSLPTHVERTLKMALMGIRDTINISGYLLTLTDITTYLRVSL